MTDERQRLKELERENFELRRTDEILPVRLTNLDGRMVRSWTCLDESGVKAELGLRVTSRLIEI